MRAVAAGGGRPGGRRRRRRGARPGRPRRTGVRPCAGTLAHGEKRKLELALLLAGEPRVMLLDEPMAGVSAEDVPALVEVIGR